MRTLIVLLCLFVFLLGCNGGTVIVEWPPPMPEEYPPPPHETEGVSVTVGTRAIYPVELHIPPGHLPPPGSCRIWYPGRPPGHQPSPGDCAILTRRVPLGAWLISRPSGEREYVHVSVYDQSRLGVVIVIRVFDYATGRFIREHIPNG